VLPRISVTLEAHRPAGIVKYTGGLIGPRKSLKGPASGGPVPGHVLYHDVHPPPRSFGDHTVLLVRLKKLVHDYRAIGKLTRFVALDRFRICINVMQSALGFVSWMSGRDQCAFDVYPTTKIIWVRDRRVDGRSGEERGPDPYKYPIS